MMKAREEEQREETNWLDLSLVFVASEIGFRSDVAS